MTWLNNGTILQIEDENEDDNDLISMILKECDDEFVKMSTSYGQIFNILLEDPLKVNEACDKYSDLFKDIHTEEADFCYICFNFLKLCFFTDLHKNIRSQVIDLIKYIKFQNTDITIQLLCTLFDDPSEFHEKYINNGGSELIYKQIIQYNEMDTTEKWISGIDHEFHNSSSEFDKRFCQFIDQPIIQCDNYLLSVILTNFVNFKKTTPHNLLDTGSKVKIHSFKKTSLENKVFWGFFHDNFSECCKYVFPKTNDMAFTVHFLHLLTLRDDKDNLNLKRELDIAILRYVEIIISDYNEEQETGLRKWAPSYLKIVNEDINPVIRRILPSIKEGLDGPYIDSIQKLPNFVVVDNSDHLLLLYDIEDLVSKLSAYESESDESYSDEEITILEKIVKLLNESYIKFNDKMKSDILLQITPYLEKFDGLSGSVISSMIYIGNNDDSTFKDSDPCPVLQKMLYDIILDSGDVPEFLIK